LDFPLWIERATEDGMFPMALARRLAATLPNAALVPIEN
jgi:pimeloyl-ACP methyl ester carboxylesterase